MQWQRAEIMAWHFSIKRPRTWAENEVELGKLFHIGLGLKAVARGFADTKTPSVGDGLNIL
jgi:hypothetical protein